MDWCGGVSEQSVVRVITMDTNTNEQCKGRAGHTILYYLTYYDNVIVFLYSLGRRKGSDVSQSITAAGDGV